MLKKWIACLEKNKKLSPKALGKKAERVAAKYLKQQGYRIIKRNYICALGEIDLIVSKANCIVLVEVKAASKNKNYPPELHFSIAKQKKLLVLARYAESFLYPNMPLRIDLICMDYQARKVCVGLRHYKSVICFS